MIQHLYTYDVITMIKSSNCHHTKFENGKLSFLLIGNWEDIREKKKLIEQLFIHLTYISSAFCVPGTVLCMPCAFKDI